MSFTTRFALVFFVSGLLACGGEEPAKQGSCPAGMELSADHTFCIQTVYVDGGTPEVVFNDCVEDADCTAGERCTVDGKCAIPCHRDDVCIYVNPSLWCGGPQIKDDPPYSSCMVNPNYTTTCPILNLGDVFKVSSSTSMTYIVDHNSEVLYFSDMVPDTTVYGSWRDNTNDVLTISQACFDVMPVPNIAPFAVNIRPGTYVIKRVSSDQLYVVLPGNTIAKITLEAAATLYEPDELGGVNHTPIVVADIFWPNFTGRSADITTAHVHPGMLFVVGNGTTVYYAEKNESIREVTESGFVANHFQWRFVRRVPLTAIQGMSLGEPINARVLSIDDPTQGV